MVKDSVTHLEKRSRSWNMRLVGHCDMDGEGDGMHINIKDGYAFFGHMGTRGTSIIDVRDPGKPRLVGRIPAPPNTHAHKVQIVDDLMVLNRERPTARHKGVENSPWSAGLSIFDVSNPLEPRELAFWSAGGRGVHRMTYWHHPYIFASAGGTDFDTEFLSIVDISNPSKPTEVGRWWMPGQRTGERRVWGEDITVKIHHGIPRGDRLYCGWWDYGLVILDVADVTQPALVSHLHFPAGESKNTHTALPLPGRDVLVVTDECNVDDCQSISYQVRVVDIADERRPQVVSHFPIPEGDFCSEGLRFGPHNLHEMRPGTYQDSEKVFLTYFNAGVRVVDVSDATAPKEIAYHIPPAPPGQRAIQLNDIIVDESGLVYVSDRYSGGLYIFELT